jgi:hypothetical protein
LFTLKREERVKEGVRERAREREEEIHTANEKNQVQTFRDEILSGVWHQKKSLL